MLFENLLFKPVANDLYALLWGTPSESIACLYALLRGTPSENTAFLYALLWGTPLESTA